MSFHSLLADVAPEEIKRRMEAFESAAIPYLLQKRRIYEQGAKVTGHLEVEMVFSLSQSLCLIQLDKMIDVIASQIFTGGSV